MAKPEKSRIRKSIRFFTRSQIQMGESVAILFIFFILLVFGFVFYMNIMRGSAKVEIEENIQLKAIGVAQKASFMPELQCSRENVVDENCIDILKLTAASGLLKDNNIYYYDIFGLSSIRVEEVYPGRDPPKEWYLYNHTLANYSDRLSTFIPVSLFNASSEKYGYGVMVVDVYKQK
ncbi:hypothetical protein KY366_01180 [Candidatus Woesearchaeota archaeon]|nr:hypothetical protein [Candidatus Woesearchaeota archaeon]